MLGFVLDLLRMFPGLLALNVLLLVAEGLLGVLSIVSLAPIIDAFITPGLEHASPITQALAPITARLGLPQTLAGFLVLFLGIQALKNAFTLLARHSLLRTKYAVLRELTVGTFNDLFQAQWQLFSGSRQGVLLNTFLRELTIVGDAFGAVALLFATAVQVAFYLAVPLVLSWQVTVTSLGTALLLTWPFLRLSRMSYRLGVRNTDTANALGSVVQEHLGIAKVILGFGNQAQSVARLREAFESHRRATLASQTLGLAIPLGYEPLGTVVIVLALALAKRLGLPLSEIAVLLWALRSSVPSLGTVAVQKNILANFLPSYQQVRELRARARFVRQRTGAQRFTSFTREIALEDVTVEHPERGPALERVSVRIPKGAMVAVVGESGSGKTTLIDTILGFHEPRTGRVTIDGVPLEAFDVTSYRRRIGYVPQESVLFNATIRENLQWANPVATHQELERACRLANAEEFIRQLPQGLETVVGDRGVRLSGGQCQRIALARALVRKPELLILDEATSALDTESERLIQQAIEAAAKETTVVVIAHRLSTIMNMDYLYVLRQGRVIEEGTYAALLQHGGPFSRMTQLQVLEGTHSV